MSHELNISRSGRFAVAQVTALAFTEVAGEVLAEIERATREAGDQRLLIDLLDVVGTFEPAFQRELGMLAFKHLSHLKKVASLVPQEKVTHLSEEAAQDQGLQLRVFTTLTDAVTWLLAP